MKKPILSTLLFLLVLTSFGQKGYKIGETVKDFSLKGIDEKMHSMNDYKNVEGFIIVFTCNHCPYSVAYEDRINAIAKKYKTEGYQLIAINPNDPISYPEDDFDHMKRRAKKKGFEFPYLVDEGQKVYPKFGATKTPHVFLLDSKKVVQYIGAIDDSTTPEQVSVNYLENAISSLKSGKKPDPSLTKAIGCSIKVAKK